MKFITRIKQSALALIAASGLVTGESLVAVTAAATQVSAVSAPVIAEERTFLDTVARLHRIGIDPSGGIFKYRPLSGLEIRAVRIAASRSTLPSRKRYLKLRKPPSYFGDKQATRMLNRLRSEFSQMGRRAA